MEGERERERNKDERFKGHCRILTVAINIALEVGCSKLRTLYGVQTCNIVGICSSVIFHSR